MTSKLNNSELLAEIEKSLVECYEYGRTSINHNPPLVEYRRLKYLIDNQIKRAETDGELKFLRKMRAHYDKGFVRLYDDVDLGCRITELEQQLRGLDA